MNWKYGNSWEKYPMKMGELWVDRKTNSKLMVNDLYNGLPVFMKEADLVYCDPPWNKSNINTFYTKAGMENIRREFTTFTNLLFDSIGLINPKVCYLEIGKQNLERFKTKMSELFKEVQVWGVTYYGNKPSYLIRGGPTKTSVDFTGMDDEYTPLKVMKVEDFNVVADLCMGRGLIAVSAYKVGKRFVGVELNKRRLANTVEKINKMGGDFYKN